MTDCTQYENLIEKYLDGEITDSEFAELESHVEACPPCREEFNRAVLMQKAVGKAFSPATTTEQASTMLLERLAVESGRFVGAAWLTPRRAAIAAGVLFAIGIFLGFAMGRTSKPARAPLSAQVPVSAGKIEGTVLVRHDGSDFWQALKADSQIYLGDTFHTAANSACVLRFNDKSRVELSQNSMLVLESYDGQTQFFLEHGECTANLESPHGPFFVSTPHGRVEALGTEFMVKVE